VASTQTSIMNFMSSPILVARPGRQRFHTITTNENRAKDNPVPPRETPRHGWPNPADRT
jgi:hypothetical protein